MYNGASRTRLSSSLFQVSTNGFFSFDREVSFTNPQLFSPSFSDAALVAPFWADNDISNRVGAISYEVHSSGSPISRVSTFISQQQQVQFSGSWMLLAEWNNVPQFNGSTDDVCTKLYTLYIFIQIALTLILDQHLPRRPNHQWRAVVRLVHLSLWPDGMVGRCYRGFQLCRGALPEPPPQWLTRY